MDASAHDDPLHNIYTDDVSHAVKEWCRIHDFEIGERVSAHVIHITWSKAEKIRKDAAIREASQIYPDEQRRIDAQTLAAENILKITKHKGKHAGKHADKHADKHASSSETRYPIGISCPICTANRLLNADCCAPNRTHYLLLCPDAILAQCCRNNETRVSTYAIVHYVDARSALILNATGSWSFDLIHRMPFNIDTREGFVAFRTYVICNIACIERANTVATTSANGHTASPINRVRGLISRIHSRNKNAPATAASAAQCTNVVVREYIIRNKINATEISLTPVTTFADALMTPARPIIFTPEVSASYAELINAIFDQEPSRIYCDTIFVPNCAVATLLVSKSEKAFESLVTLARQEKVGANRDVFNYWRGWRWPYVMPSDASPVRAIVAPIIEYIKSVLCAADQSISSRAPSIVLTDLAHFVVSWFAHIIQLPNTAPPRSIIVLRGFSDDILAPFLHFVGKVIGAQYYTAANDARIRPDSLFIVRNAADISREMFDRMHNSCMRVIIIANDIRWQLSREHQMLISRNIVQLNARDNSFAELAKALPIANDDNARQIYTFFARFSPLALNYF